MRLIFFISFICLAGCSSRHMQPSQVSNSAPVSINGKLFNTFYQQRAAEYRALCLQAYNIARFRLDQYHAESNRPKAIITDIDETVLDNSPYEAHQTLQGKDYDQASWFEWTDRAAADTLPGSATFLKYAASKGVEIFYITNRELRERTATINNLIHFNLPDADTVHVLCRQTTSGKEPRRQSVAATHEIMMLVGDNLADFSSLFDKKMMEERLQNTNNTARDFGTRFIIIPNPVYGDWEGALFNYNRNLAQAQKDSTIKAALKTY